jgi:D-3-phosphoglycerate dehydrogenase
MINPKIFILEKINIDGLIDLKDKFEIIDLSHQNVDQNDIILKDAFAIIVKSKVIVDIKIKKTSPKLKIVARAGTGMENID